MIEYFSKDHTGNSFELFGPAHLIMLGVFLGINLALIIFRGSFSDSLRNKARIFLAGLLAVNEIVYQVWLITTG